MSKRYWYIYILRCADSSLYTGIARDVTQRVARHNAGKGARYTRGRRPVVLVYRERASSQGVALRRELAIKRLPAAAKWRLVGRRQERPGGRMVRGRRAPARTDRV